MLYIIIAILSISIFVFPIVNQFTRNKKRQNELKIISVKLGLNYSEFQNGLYTYLKDKFNFFATVPNFGIKNILHGKYQNYIDFIIFDQIVPEKYFWTSFTTIIYAKLNSINIPDFYISPKTIYDKMGINYKKYNKFKKQKLLNRKFLVYSDNHEEISKFITPEVDLFFSEMNNNYFEVKSSSFIFLKPDKMIKTVNFQEFIEEFNSIVDHLGKITNLKI